MITDGQLNRLDAHEDKRNKQLVKAIEELTQEVRAFNTIVSSIQSHLCDASTSSKGDAKESTNVVFF